MLKLITNSLLIFNSLINMKQFILIDKQQNQKVAGLKLVYKVIDSNKSLINRLFDSKSEEITFLRPLQAIWDSPNKKGLSTVWLQLNYNYKEYKDAYLGLRYTKISIKDKMYSLLMQETKKFIINDTTSIKKITLKEQVIYNLLLLADKINNRIIIKKN